MINSNRRPCDNALLQVLDHPLHNPKIIHHLNERNEEDDGRQLHGVRKAYIAPQKKDVQYWQRTSVYWRYLGRRRMRHQPVLGWENRLRAWRSIWTTRNRRQFSIQRGRWLVEGINRRWQYACSRRQSESIIRSREYLPWNVISVSGRCPEAKLEDKKTKDADGTISQCSTLQNVESILCNFNLSRVGELAGWSGKPKADPNTIPKRQSQPIASLVVLGNLYQGVWMAGPHTAPIGSDTTELGMKRKAMMLKNPLI